MHISCTNQPGPVPGCTHFTTCKGSFKVYASQDTCTCCSCPSPSPPSLAPARWPSPQITYLFKDVLHGLGRFVLVVNVSPDAAEFNETKRVLQVGVNGCSLHRVG